MTELYLEKLNEKLNIDFISLIFDDSLYFHWPIMYNNKIKF